MSPFFLFQHISIRWGNLLLPKDNGTASGILMKSYPELSLDQRMESIQMNNSKKTQIARWVPVARSCEHWKVSLLLVTYSERSDFKYYFEINRSRINLQKEIFWMGYDIQEYKSKCIHWERRVEFEVYGTVSLFNARTVIRQDRIRSKFCCKDDPRRKTNY